MGTACQALEHLYPEMVSVGSAQFSLSRWFKFARVKGGAAGLTSIAIFLANAAAALTMNSSPKLSSIDW